MKVTIFLVRRLHGVQGGHLRASTCRAVRSRSTRLLRSYHASPQHDGIKAIRNIGIIAHVDAVSRPVPFADRLREDTDV